MTGHLSPYEADFEGNPPAERVQAYVELMGRTIEKQEAAGGWVYADEIHTLNNTSLTLSDLRDVLNELAEHQKLLSEIYDTVMHISWGPATRIMRLREILGEATTKPEEPDLRAPHEHREQS
jgi:hypothetical protein